MTLDGLDPIVLVDENTYIHGAWYGGAGPGATIMVTLYRPEDSPLLARGRIRVHNDDKLFGSEDTKHLIEAVARPGAKASLFRRKVASKLRQIQRKMGEHNPVLTWVPVNGNSEVFVRAMERAALKDGSFRVGMVEHTPEDAGSSE
jgi:hypothetical protein